MIVEPGYLDHWKTVLLRELTGKEWASEIPIRLWEYCQLRMDDFIPDTSGKLIARVCRWKETPDQLLEALVECRFLKKTSKGFIVHQWRDRQRGHFANRINGHKGGRPRLVKPKKPTGSESITQINPSVISENPNNSSGSHNSTQDKPKPQFGGVEEKRGEEMRVEEKRGATPKPLREGLSCEQVKAAVCKIFGLDPAQALSHAAEHAIAELVPIPADDMRCVAWFYALPDDDRVSELKTRHQKPKTLLENWSDAVAVSRNFEKKSRGGSAKKKALPEPAGWGEWLEKNYATAQKPASFFDLPEQMQRLFNERQT